MPLKEAHAIGESLQIKIEELPEVERAFVHLDFECDHKPEHSILTRELVNLLVKFRIYPCHISMCYKYLSGVEVSILELGLACFEGKERHMIIEKLCDFH